MVNMNKLDKNRMDLKKQEESNYFGELCDVIDTLLSEGGCPWDREQTHESLRMELLEESYEAADAIDNNDANALCEELGDLFFLFYSIQGLLIKAGISGFQTLLKTYQKSLFQGTAMFSVQLKNRVKRRKRLLKFGMKTKTRRKIYQLRCQIWRQFPKHYPLLCALKKL